MLSKDKVSVVIVIVNFVAFMLLLHTNFVVYFSMLDSNVL